MADRSDLVAFLRAVDARVTRPGRIRLIGGAVVSLAYASSYQTRDLDYAWADREVDEAIRAVAAAWPDLPVRQTGMYFAPHDYEDRLETLQIPGLQQLRVEIPERHDLAIMKIARGLERDLDPLLEMQADEPFELETLVQRYDDTWVAGSQRLADIGFENALVAIFGDEEAEVGKALLAEARDRKARGARGPRRPKRRR